MVYIVGTAAVVAEGSVRGILVKMMGLLLLLLLLMLHLLLFVKLGGC